MFENNIMAETGDIYTAVPLNTGDNTVILEQLDNC